MSISEPTEAVTGQGRKGWYGQRQLVWQVGAYLIINAMFVALWASGGSRGHHGSFWPIWPIIFWGVGVAFFALRSLTSRAN